LVVIDIGPLAPQSGSSQRIQNFLDGAELDSIEDFVERSMKFNPRRDPDLLRVSLLHNLRELPNGKWTWKYDKRHYLRPTQPDLSMRLLKTTWDGVPGIACPTLVVRGGDSDILSARVGKQLAERFPNGTYVEVPRAGHIVQSDNPADLVADLRRFLSGQMASPAI
jgi:pimeloyl-ACP methyl ester carboxylesterase